MSDPIPKYDEILYQGAITMKPIEQERLARRIAANIGYVLVTGLEAADKEAPFTPLGLNAPQDIEFNRLRRDRDMWRDRYIKIFELLQDSTTLGEIR